MKHFFKSTMLMFVAAAMMLATACSEKDDPNAITETNILGEWGFTDNTQNLGITLNADHTCKVGNQPYNWTLKGKTFSATQDGTTNTCEFDITELDGNTMKIAGSYVYFGAQSDYSGTLLRTHTETPSALNESDMVGKWEVHKTTATWSEGEFLLNADHTGYIIDAFFPIAWSISGNNLVMDPAQNGIRYLNATVKSITYSAKQVVLNVDWTEGLVQSGGNTAASFSGTFVRKR